PIIRIVVPDRNAMGGEFWRWSVATVVAGTLLGVNPFDEPDVEAAKDKTRALLQEYERAGELREDAPLLTDGHLTMYAGPRYAARFTKDGGLSLAEVLRTHLQPSAGDYFALLAYVHRTEERHALLSQLRLLVRDRLGCATALSYGPAYLHSAGQLHKGGPA